MSYSIDDIKKSIFSDTTDNFVSPAEPERNSKVTVRFRGLKDAIDAVYILTETDDVLMSKADTRGNFDYFQGVIYTKETKVSYCFWVIAGGEKFFFDRRGVSHTPDKFFAFTLVPGFKTPVWAKGAVMYQIYVDRFFNGDRKNDVLTGEYKYINRVTRKKDWEEPIGEDGIVGFYGGDLEGVRQKLDYLKDLGVEVIYFNPLFVSPSNHKYDIQDYEHIDPHFGKLVEDEGELLNSEWDDNSNATRYRNRVTSPKNLEASDALFQKVVEEAHERGIRVILDGVFNHCGSFNKWLDREKIYDGSGAYISEESPYRDYFYFDKTEWPENDSYEGWWGHNTLPKLNYDSSKLYQSILNVAKKWVSKPYCADGWRLDVAADLGKTPEQNHGFWKAFRNTVKEANKDALILAEHYGDPSSWLAGDEWDSVMNYDAFMEPVTWFLTGMQKHSDAYKPEMEGNVYAFWEAMLWNGAKFSHPSRMVAMNQLSNHDHSRFLTRTNKKVGRVEHLGAYAADQGVRQDIMRQAVIMQMTWPGAPTLYYGDEAGLCGFTDPDNRRPYPWGREDMELLDFHKKIIAIHKDNPALKYGSLMKLRSDPNIMAYARIQQDDICIIMINTRDHNYDASVSVWETGLPYDGKTELLMISHANGYSCEKQELKITDGFLTLNMLPHSAYVIKGIFAEKNLAFLNIL